MRLIEIEDCNGRVVTLNADMITSIEKLPVIEDGHKKGKRTYIFMVGNEDNGVMMNGSREEVVKMIQDKVNDQIIDAAEYLAAAIAVQINS